jgi:hypothetical protein
MHALAAVDRLDVAVMVRLAVDDKASKSVTDWLLSHDQIETCTCSALFLKIDSVHPWCSGRGVAGSNPATPTIYR